MSEVGGGGYKYAHHICEKFVVGIHQRVHDGQTNTQTDTRGDHNTRLYTQRCAGNNVRQNPRT